MNELENIINLLVCLQSQSYNDFELVVCVNQYDSWWNDEDKENICHDNSRSITLLEEYDRLDIKIIDRSSLGNGWPPKKGGVGWARKILMDDISARANENDIIVSIDADTYYPEDYLSTVKSFFEENRKLFGVAIPYYHKLNNDETDRLILRYEIYMRYYMINMMRIDNPYCFTAVGSAMAFPVWAYKKVGGLTPVVAGEDFYFLQKLAKSGNIGLSINTMAYPSSRFSDRVAFGTGPALIKGRSGNWQSYPVYPSDFFDNVGITYNKFSELYTQDIGTPMDSFFDDHFGMIDIWKPLRLNYKDIDNFKKACIIKVDGLRILQYLRWLVDGNSVDDEENIVDFLMQYHKSELHNDIISTLRLFNFQKNNIEKLNEVRDFLFNIETQARQDRFVTNRYNYA